MSRWWDGTLEQDDRGLRLEGWTLRLPYLLWHGLWTKEGNSVVDCLVPDGAYAETFYCPCGRSVGCPFPAPGYLNEALEESCGGLKV